MLMVLLDSGVIYGLTAAFGDTDSVSMWPLIGSALGIAVCFLLAINVAAASGSLAVLAGALAAVAGVAFLVFWAVCQLTPGRAAIAAGILLGYRVALVVAFTAAFG